MALVDGGGGAFVFSNDPKRLESKGVRILGRQDESYGRFAWVRDADGYRVEIDQPLITP